MERSYRVIVEPDDGAFAVRIPTFPGAFTWGPTVEAALASAQDVITLEIASRTERGEDVPEPDAMRGLVATVTVPAA
jgi:predicted RNase H-like HicB family nuclease